MSCLTTPSFRPLDEARADPILGLGSGARLVTTGQSTAGRVSCRVIPCSAYACRDPGSSRLPWCWGWSCAKAPVRIRALRGMCGTPGSHEQVASGWFCRSRLCLRCSQNSVTTLRGCWRGGPRVVLNVVRFLVPIHLRWSDNVGYCGNIHWKSLFAKQMGPSPCLGRQDVILTVQSYTARDQEEARRQIFGQVDSNWLR